jgi:hypothetical protein
MSTDRYNLPRIKSRIATNLNRRLAQIGLLVTGYWLLVTSGYAQPISSSELINNAKQYDGQTIFYQGEVVGDVMVRRDFVWLNLFDGENAIGVWLKKETLPDIKFVGGYQQKGDWLEVAGIFHASCLQHGGDLDLHAEKVKIIAQGYKIKEEVHPAKRIWARNLSALALFLLVCIVIREVFHKLKKS